MRKSIKSLYVVGSILLGTALFAQDKIVTGKVIDRDGISVSDALVRSSNGNEVFTDKDGLFSIESAIGDQITIEALGLPIQILTVTNTNYYLVTIRTVSELSFGEQIQLNPVVITALGIKKTSDAVTNAQKIVGSAELNQASSSTAIQSLIGKVSGLNITTTNNSVDSNYRIVLRGARSITSSNQALVVIDNVISSIGVLQQFPPEAIDNINVIKGLQGAALYGEQGVNGVIIVTTKRGNKADKLQFTFTSSIDVSEVFMLPKIQKRYGKGVEDDGWDNVDYNGTNYIPWENMSWGPAFSDPRIGGRSVPSGLPQKNGEFIYEEYSPIKNHYKNFFKNGTLLQNGFTISAGGSDAYTFFSLNRTENNFVIMNDKLTQNSFLFKAGKKINKFRIDGDVNYINKTVTNTNSNLYQDAIQTPSNNNVRKYRNSGMEGYLTAYATNPYWIIENERYDSRSDYFSGIISLEYELNSNVNITYRGNLATRSANNERHSNDSDYSQVYDMPGTAIHGNNFGQLGTGDISSWYYSSTSKERKYYGDLMINFDYDLSDHINLKANLGNNIQDSNYTIKTVGGKSLRTPGWYNVQNVLKPDLYSSLDNSVSNFRKVAWFANIDLSYQNFLFLNGTYRMEQNSVLSRKDIETNKFTNKPYHYYSGGVSFLPNKAFDLSSSDILSYSKIAMSYTRVGNSAIAPYVIDETGVFPTGYPFGNLSSYIQNISPTSTYLKNEFMSTIDINMMLGFFKNRVNVEGSVYQTETDKLITHSTTSSASGLARLQDNVGKMRLRGIEIDMNVTPIKSTAFTWDFKAAFSSSRSKVVELADGTNEVALLSYSNPGVGIFAIKGENFPMIKGTKFQRDDQNRIIVDARGNPITTTTFEVLGKATPDYVLDFSTSFRFKNFKLVAVMDYRHGGKFISFTKHLLAFTGGLPETGDFDRSQGYIVPNSVQNVGTKENPIYITNTKSVGDSPDYSGVMNYFSSNSYRSVGENLLVDGTAFKMREIALNYDLPASLLNSSFIHSLTIGAYARNPFFIYAKDNKNYADPETASTSGNATGIALNTQYPSIRSFGFNLKAAF